MGWRAVLAQIERTATRAGRARCGRISIEGTRLHERALRAGVAVEAALIGDAFGDSEDRRTRRLLDQLARSGCELHVVSREVIDRLTDGRDLGAIVGLTSMPPAADLEQIVSRSSPPGPVVLVALDVEDPGNLGAMVRTALACGAAAFVGVGASDPFHPRAVRTSMGSLFKLPILRCADLAELGTALRSGRFSTVAAVSRGGTPLPEIALDAAALALVIGGEAHGLPADLAAAVDQRVSIPMPQGVDSLSVNAATAILLYETLRRRRSLAARGLAPGNGLT